MILWSLWPHKAGRDCDGLFCRCGRRPAVLVAVHCRRAGPGVPGTGEAFPALTPVRLLRVPISNFVALTEALPEQTSLPRNGYLNCVVGLAFSCADLSNALHGRVEVVPRDVATLSAPSLSHITHLRCPKKTEDELKSLKKARISVAIPRETIEIEVLRLAHAIDRNSGKDRSRMSDHLVAFATVSITLHYRNHSRSCER
ncbi:hypothetical protein ABIB57_001993 [Devosia sp. UYZn731]